MARQSSGEGSVDLEWWGLNQVSPNAFDMKDLCQAAPRYQLVSRPSQ